MSQAVADHVPRAGRRIFWKYLAGPLFGGVVAILLAVAWSSTKGLLAMPQRLARVETRSVRDSARTDSLFRIQAGTLSVLCFGLSDKAFEAAKQTCGEAFAVSRIIAGERARQP